MAKLKLTEVEALRYWLDTEITMLHVGFYILLGLIVHGRIWWFCGVMIALSLRYAAIRTAALPTDYLRVKKTKERTEN